MEKIITQKFDVVESETGTEYSNRINEYLSNKSYQNVQVDHRDRSNFCAYVTYEEVELVPETAKDEYKMNGVSFQCTDCPYCEKSEDRRVKILRCSAKDDSGNELIRASHEACDFFYEEMKATGLWEMMKGGERAWTEKNGRRRSNTN